MNNWNRIVKFVRMVSPDSCRSNIQERLPELKAAVNSIEDALVHAPSMTRVLDRAVADIVNDYEHDDDERTIERILMVESVLLTHALDFTLAVLDGRR